jgi:hypothetical protein
LTPLYVCRYSATSSRVAGPCSSSISTMARRTRLLLLLADTYYAISIGSIRFIRCCTCSRTWQTRPMNSPRTR